MPRAPVIEELAHGSRAILIPVSRLETVRNELLSFAQSTELSGFHRVGKPVDLSEEEVGTLLRGGIKGALTDSLREKVRYLGLDSWPDAIPRNIRAILTNPDRRARESGTRGDVGRPEERGAT